MREEVAIGSEERKEPAILVTAVVSAATFILGMVGLVAGRLIGKATGSVDTVGGIILALGSVAGIALGLKFAGRITGTTRRGTRLWAGVAGGVAGLATAVVLVVFLKPVMRFLPIVPVLLPGIGAVIADRWISHRD